VADVLAVALPGQLSEFEVTAVAELPTLTRPADELDNVLRAEI